MIVQKPRIQIGPPADLDDLFPPRSAPLPSPPVALRWRGCVVCGRRDAQRAHAAHDVCSSCATDPAATRASLGRQRAAVIRQQHEAAATERCAWDALDASERDRVERLLVLRQAKVDGTATTADLDLLRRSGAALASDDVRYSPGFRAYLHEHECLFWANAAEQAGQHKVNAQLAQLANYLEAQP